MMKNRKKKQQTEKSMLRIRMKAGRAGREAAGEMTAFAVLYMGLFAFVSQYGFAGESGWLCSFAGLLLLLGCTGFERRSEKIRKYLCMITALLSVLFLMMLITKSTWVYQGALLACNDFLEQLGRQIGRYQSTYELTADEIQFPACSRLFLVFLGSFLAGVCEAMRVGKSRRLVMVSGFCVLGADIFLHSAGISAGTLLTALGVLLTGLLFEAGEKKGEKRAGSGKSFAGLQNMGIVAFLLLLGLIPAAFGQTGEDVRGRWAKAVKETVTESLAQLRYGGKKTDSMPKGQFAKLGNLELKDDTALRVIMEKPSSMYFRGYVGSIYNGDGWEEAAVGEIYDRKDMFYWLHESGFSGLSQLSALCRLEDPEDADTGKLIVENVGADREYCYVPYELASIPEEIEGVYSFGDVNLKAEGILPGRTFQYQVHTNLVKHYPQLAADFYMKRGQEAFAEYIKNENSYNAFVYEQFLQVPDNLKQVLKKILGEEQRQAKDHMSYEEANTLITGYLNQNIRYSEEINESSGGDFAERFLETDKIGYSVHYATAATLMYRYLGIPSRYVEGYLLTPELAEETENYAQIELTGREAHAWTEIYQDGVGWIPMEVTPAYLDKMERPEFEIASYVSGENGKGEGIQGTAEDIQDEEEPKPETEKGTPKTSIWKLLAGGAVVLLFLAVMLCFLYILLGRRKLQRELKKLDSPDIREALCYNYVWMMRWLKYGGIVYIGGSRYGLQAEISEKYGTEFAEKYCRATKAAEEAAYSSHEIKPEQLLAVKEQLREVKTRVLKEKNMLCKIRMRIWDFLY